MPTPVSVTETSTAPFEGRPHVDPAALGRELQCVGEQVEEHLLHLALVGANRSETFVERELERDPWPAARSRTRVSVFSAALRQIEIAQLQLHPSRLDLGEIQDVVDQREQVVPRLQDVADVFGLFFVKLAEHALVSTSEKPMIALSGVRSSCDMLARNSLLLRFAASSSRYRRPISSLMRFRSRLARRARRGSALRRACRSRPRAISPKRASIS